MRLKDDVRKCVAFVGWGTGDGFDSAGTAFFIHYKDFRYLVTTSHVAEDLADDPFTIRVNSQQGNEPLDVTVDIYRDGEQYRWRTHDDPSVDLAIMPFDRNFRFSADVLFLPDTMFVAEPKFAEEDIGIGDLCYAVGLFRLMQGQKRNLPFVHTGNIGLLPADERIPVSNWRDEKSPPILVEGYLVEMTSLEGLSGSPVLVRPSFVWEWPNATGERPKVMRMPDANVLLLGVWQGAWSGDPDGSLARQISRQEVKVPMGIGVVVPTSKLIELLEQADVVRDREALERELERRRAARPETTS